MWALSWGQRTLAAASLGHWEAQESGRVTSCVGAGPPDHGSLGSSPPPRFCSPPSAGLDGRRSVYTSQSQGSISHFCAYFRHLEIGLRKDIMFPWPENVFFPTFGSSCSCSALSVNTRREASPDAQPSQGFPDPVPVPRVLGHSACSFVDVHWLVSPGRGRTRLAALCLPQ